jgi:hypothetical protein
VILDQVCCRVNSEAEVPGIGLKALCNDGAMPGLDQHAPLRDESNVIKRQRFPEKPKYL